MRLHRFIGNFDIQADSLKITDKDVLGQIRNVLRLSEGDFLILGDGQGNEAKAEIIDLQKNSVEIKILERAENMNESDLQINLYAAVIKNDNFDLVVAKASELGVAKIIPIITERTVKTGLKHDRLNRIAKEAAETAERGKLPQFLDAINFEDALKHAKTSDTVIFFNHSGSRYSAKLTENKKIIAIFIGPEGGWTDKEIMAAKEHGFEIISLGKRNLRAETAAIAALSLLLAQ